MDTLVLLMDADKRNNEFNGKAAINLLLLD
jgi:hypothetical protein